MILYFVGAPMRTGRIPTLPADISMEEQFADLQYESDSPARWATLTLTLSHQHHNPTTRHPLS